MAKKKNSKGKNSKPKTKKKATVSKRYSRFVAFLKDERFHISLGLSTIAFSVLLTISFISFIFTGGADQSLKHKGFWELMLNFDGEVANWVGKIGAFFSNFFISNGFGIASFSFVFLFVIVGFRLLKLRMLPFGKSIKYSAIVTVWLSICLGYIFVNSEQDTHLYLGGAYGFFISEWLNSLIGKIGTFFVLFISLLVFILYTFNNFADWLKGILKSAYARQKQKPLNKKSNNATKKTFENSTESEIEDLEEFAENTPLSIEIPDTEIERTPEENVSVEGEIKEIDLETSVEIPKNNITEKGDLELTVDDKTQDGAEPEIETETTEKEEEAPKAINLEPFDPKLELSSFQLPSIQLLANHKSENSEVSKEELITNKNKIVETLAHYKIQIDKIKATIGPTITLYEIVPAPGVRISKIKNLEDDIALSLSALGIRIIAPMPGKGTIGIEVPNRNPEIVSMRSIIASTKFQESKYVLPVALGKTISNETYVFDLAKMPHLLVAGATGQGKSVGLNAILTSLIYKKHPAELKFVLVDPKKVELSIYSKIEKYYLAKLPDTEDAIITDTRFVVNTLNSLTIEMDLRYNLLKDASVRNIIEYNRKFTDRRLNPEKGHRFLPYIVLVVDEFADLIMTAGKEIENPIARIAQLARAIGIHLIIATQRPSTNIITGMIKANFPARIAFKVTSMIDSRTILDTPGANQLIGRGDMLISSGNNLVRIQCAFIDTPEIDEIVEFISSQQSYPSAYLLPEYVDENTEESPELDLSQRDALFEEAARMVVIHQQGSTSLIQRKLSIGYNRAGRIIDQLEAAGVVGPFEGSKARQVLYTDEYSLEQFLNSL
ncbi:MAG: DNA translocase FtsK [Bacteroidetes bacterium]|jgi:DNA segregation ATPase FtsK/SpoIIIE, S-DNA-T family|nr:DNA translocase FtsK [Bacteroidota bacterium]MBT6685017.1 DNA translocase FtsK [Bacteroidota bacterium]MBT7143095.1 DNA translocase FtsK [Bacteroidota bacterium]MBT7491492.1 DNA translocase FtsK [Bacteroidota bacterium]